MEKDQCHNTASRYTYVHSRGAFWVEEAVSAVTYRHPLVIDKIHQTHARTPWCTSTPWCTPLHDLTLNTTP